MHKLLAAPALAALLLASPALAVTVTSTTTSGGNTAEVIEASASQISVDFDIRDFSPITVSFGVEAGDAQQYSFDSVIDVFTGVGAAARGLSFLTLTLGGGATFATPLGTVTPAFSTASTTLNAAGTELRIQFSPEENVGVTLGDLGGTLGDFLVDRGTAGGFSLAVAGGAVPEPATWLSLVLGFALVGAAVRRRGNARQVIA